MRHYWRLAATRSDRLLASRSARCCRAFSRASARGTVGKFPSPISRCRPPVATRSTQLRAPEGVTCKANPSVPPTLHRPARVSLRTSSGDSSLAFLGMAGSSSYPLPTPTRWWDGAGCSADAAGRSFQSFTYEKSPLRGLVQRLAWRSRRDSNPRCRFCPHTPLAGEHLRPLGHSSIDRDSSGSTPRPVVAQPGRPAPGT